MIHLRTVEKRYARGSESVLACAVDRLDIAPGEQVALVGRSGTGKTTLLHILAGILRPDCGEVEVAGARLDQLGESAREQAVAGKRAIAGLAPIEIERLLGLVGGVHEIGNAGLHFKGQFVLGDSRFNLRVLHSQGVLAVERFDRCDVPCLLLGLDPRWIVQV